jgi:hypothetical protein
MCLFPVIAQSQEFGKPKLDPEGDIMIPCGKCTECKSKRAAEWALRCRHEMAMHDENCFITLTYNEDKLPSFLIVKDYFQKFIKKLRKKVRKKVKYIVSHEYGGRTGRPHHHAILFGWTPPNQSYLMKAPSGEPLFVSQTLENLWTDDKRESLGYHSIGEANEKTAFYIASYALKSCIHTIYDPDTNTPVTVSDTMNVSTRPAIGREFFLEHYKSIIEKEKYLPRYYVKLLEKELPYEFEKYQNMICQQHKERGIYERHAKFLIDRQKKNLEKPGLRSAPEEKALEDKYLDQLVHDRDHYVTLKRRNQ